MLRNRALLPPIGYSLFGYLSFARLSVCANDRHDRRTRISCGNTHSYLRPFQTSAITVYMEVTELNCGIGGPFLPASIRCRECDFFCLLCFVKWQNWQLAHVPVIFSRMDPARNRLYALVKRIPKGRVVTYGQLARAARLPGGARAA